MSGGFSQRGFFIISFLRNFMILLIFYTRFGYILFDLVILFCLLDYPYVSKLYFKLSFDFIMIFGSFYPS